MEVAKQIWPDSILSEIPKHLLADDTLTDVKKTEFVVQGDADYSPDDDIIEVFSDISSLCLGAHVCFIYNLLITNNLWI